MCPGSMGRLLIERFPVANAAFEKLRPVRHLGERFRLLRQKFPQLWMMPAQLVTARIAVRADAVPQPPHLGEQLLACHVGQVFVQLSYSVSNRSAIVVLPCGKLYASTGE